LYFFENFSVEKILRDQLQKHDEVKLVRQKSNSNRIRHTRPSCPTQKL